MLLSIGIFFSVLGILFFFYSPIRIAEKYISTDGVIDPQFMCSLEQLPIPTLLFGIILIFLSLFFNDAALFDRTMLEKTIKERFLLVKLFLFSLLALFFELLVIRWLSAEVRVLSYYKNIALICCFLGLGLGYALGKSKFNCLPLFIPLLGLLSFIGFSPYGKLIGTIHVPSIEEEYFWIFSKTPNFLFTVVFYVLIVLIFLVHVAAFIPLGQAIGYSMSKIPALKGYAVNIFGNLIGIAIFCYLSHFSLPPVIWFIVGIVLYSFICLHRHRMFLVELALSIIIIFGVWHYDQNSIWSPYYKINVYKRYLDLPFGDRSSFFQPEKTGKISWGYHIAINHSSFIDAIDLSDEFLRKHSDYFSQGIFSYPTAYMNYRYIVPFEISRPNRVLIVGAGTGNDVAAALRYGAKQVDAVDIDPIMFELGRRLHPEEPYSSSRVSLITNDARAYFNNSKEKYNHIIFAALDSRTLLSGMSSNRLDSFVYTKESFKAMSSLLSKDGIVSVYFFSMRPWISQRIRKLVCSTFPNYPLLTEGSNFFITGPGINNKAIQRVKSDSNLSNILYLDKEKGWDEKTVLLSDNWPFLYLKSQSIPSTYYVIIAFLVLTSIFFIRKVYAGFRKIDLKFLFLGAAFLLLETKGITEMSLLFGSTWIVNSVVFAGILFTILLATIVSMKWERISINLAYLLLISFLLIQNIFSYKYILLSPITVRCFLGGTIFSIPIFFAALIFAQLFKNSKDIPIALGSNMLGAVIGGFMEYSSLIFGIKALNLIALSFYGLSYLFRRK